MSQQLRNNHNYSKLPPAKQMIYQQPNNLTETHSVDEDQGSSTDDALSTDQNGIQQNTTCTLHSQNQVANNRTVEFTRWCEKKPVQDWKNFLLSTSPTLANVQTPHLQQQQTQRVLNTDSLHNRINQQHPTAYTYSHAFNGDYRPTIGHETERNSGAIDSRRAFMEKLRANNTPAKYWFQARLLENRIKTEYYPPGLIERIRLEKERLRTGLAHIETLMRNPNKHGYVMLDDRAISVLVTIIDRILPKDINLEMLSPQSYEY